MSSEFVNCPNCGTRNFVSDVYCGICKTKLTSGEIPSSYKRKRKNNEPTEKEKTIGGIVLFIIIAVVIGVCNSSKDEKKDAQPKEVKLNASVTFNGTQFVIRNNDNFNYSNVDLWVNTNYALRAGTLYAGQTYTVGMMQFANLDGKRFTFEDKPQWFKIWCQVTDSVDGTWEGMFN